MIRKQLYIAEEHDRGLKRLASSSGRSEAWHVRTALDRYLAAELDVVADPLGELVGLVTATDGPTDVADSHDKYLYEVAEERGEYRA